jgi:transposase
MACDGHGRPVRFVIAPGQSHDILAVPALLKGYAPAAVLADRAYDANSLRNHLDHIGAQAIIPSTRSRRAQIPHDPVLYRLRNRIERCFNKLKHFRRFATRYDRLVSHYAAFVHIAAAMIWMR